VFVFITLNEIRIIEIKKILNRKLYYSYIT